MESKGSHQKLYPVNKGLCCLQHEEQKEKRSTPEVHYNRSCKRCINEEHKLHEDDKVRKRFCSVAPEQSHNNSRHLNVSGIPTNGIEIFEKLLIYIYSTWFNHVPMDYDTALQNVYCSVVLCFL